MPKLRRGVAIFCPLQNPLSFLEKKSEKEKEILMVGGCHFLPLPSKFWLK